MTPLARIARLSAAFLASNMTRAAIAFALTLALGRGLGVDGLGRWVLCTTWASAITAIADLGFGVLLTRDGARPGAPAGRLVATALAIRLAVAIPLGLAMCAGASWLTPPETALGLRLAALLGVGGVAYGCFGAMLRSQPRWLPTVLGLETAWLAVQLAGSFGIVVWTAASRGSDGSRWSGGSSGLVGSGSLGWLAGAGSPVGGGAAHDPLTSLLVLAIAVQLAQIATALILWRPVFGGRGRVGDEREPLMALVRRALPFALSGLVANLQARVGPLMLGSLSTPLELGLFAAASRFGRFVRLAPQAMFAGALPVLSQEYARDRAAAERVVLTVDRVLVAAAAALAVGALLLARPLLGLVYGAPFVAAAPALVWVAIGLMPSLTNSAQKIALYAAGAESAVARWSAIALAVQVAAAAVLMPALGAAGAAIAVAVGEVAVWRPLRRAASNVQITPTFTVTLQSTSGV